MPNEVCSKCHEDMMNCKCENFHPNVVIDTSSERDLVFAECYVVLNRIDPELATKFFNNFKATTFKFKYHNDRK